MDNKGFSRGMFCSVSTGGFDKGHLSLLNKNDNDIIDFKKDIVRIHTQFKRELRREIKRDLENIRITEIMMKLI